MKRVRTLWYGVMVTMSLAAGLSVPAAAETASRQPNILIIVADDLGYSDIGAFGGEIATPNLDALVKSGIAFTGFYTAPTCSPTRAMLLTGRDNHEAGLGTMAEGIMPDQLGKPGYEGYLSNRTATLAEMMAKAGYATFMSGKWHLGLTEETSPAARGFQRSFALLDGAHNHFGADQDGVYKKSKGGSLYRENGVLVRFPIGRYSSDYFTDRMLDYMQSADPVVPFFAYMTFTAPHWPLQAPDAEIAKYRGRYDAGPAALRASRIKRMKELGLRYHASMVCGLRMLALDCYAGHLRPQGQDPSWCAQSREERAANLIQMRDANCSGGKFKYMEQAAKKASVVNISLRWPFLKSEAGDTRAILTYRRVWRHAHVEIIVDRLHQLIKLMLKKVVGIANFIMMDGDTLLGAQLVDQLLHGARRYNLVCDTLHNNARCRAGRQEAEVIHIGWRRHGYKPAHFGATHEQLHCYPCAKAEPCDPCRLRFGMEALDPIERRCCIRQLANAIVKRALRTPHATEVEAQNAKTAPYKGLVKRLRNTIIHRAAALRVRVKDHRDRRARAGRGAETPFEAAFGAWENHVWHSTWLTGIRNKKMLHRLIDSSGRLTPI